MVTLEMIAQAALALDNLALRSLVQDFLRQHPQLSAVQRPDIQDPQSLSASAALLELLASRLGQSPPDWTRDIGAAPQPFFLIQSAARMRNLRVLCETQSPEPLRKRHFYAPPNFLSFA